VVASESGVDRDGTARHRHYHREPDDDPPHKEIVADAGPGRKEGRPETRNTLWASVRECHRSSAGDPELLLKIDRSSVCEP
jgi:hypothetical protein